MREYALHQASQEFHGLLFGNLRRAAKNWFKRRMVRQVQDLDDYILKDIGLSREDVTQALDLPLAYDPIIELERRLDRRRRFDDL
jgi:uncharacterized protein YjiS (DUF1127 family)